MATSILIVNPNSSESISRLIFETTVIPPGSKVGIFTGPPAAPPSINDEETALASEKACIEVLVNGVAKEYDAYLVACYSDHPLVGSLRKAFPEKPVIGIFEASVTHALLLGARFGIVTTGKAWEALLTEAVDKFLGAPNSAKFAGVVSTGLGVLELHDADPKEVARKIGEGARLLADNGADVICLGCAGMSGMEEAVKMGVEGRNIQVVDGVQAGVELLAGLARRKAPVV